MKIRTVIKADFFINPENYGFFPHDDLEAIWSEMIEPCISIIEPATTRIDNASICEFINIYRTRIRNLT